MAVSRVDEGLALIDETIGRIEENGEQCFLPEPLPVKDGLSLYGVFQLRSRRSVPYAVAELSRQQGARVWELRAAMDLAQLWANRGKPENGRSLLQPILEQFTKGRDTADLQTAESLRWGRFGRSSRFRRRRGTSVKSFSLQHRMGHPSCTASPAPTRSAPSSPLHATRLRPRSAAATSPATPRLSSAPARAIQMLATLRFRDA